ncbi:hypothetical protein MetMK1DRAFT_00025530 [Metallosphaera yellowstonensis MK1]|jgi:predicted nuclease with RNAse H fold|uniref:DUF429 domain-containing protein n=1 Tax=Metallosphaera yellowstonensis MK1 TaxID=671065 RepID=H2C7K4_9CREN|nr:DUF429 domain-containing protein [Metallosphaera yellowstonensis]EHP68130.1 hypothetical protein MetMK1DRAFT_00025530 [Metallosphaera yellowstonensis MK1]
MECGIDLAVKRPTAVAVLEHDKIEVTFVKEDEEIIFLCKNARLVAIDAPLSWGKGYREVDKLLIRSGFRVFPPSFISTLTERALRLAPKLRAIETHPSSSLRLLGWDWRRISKIKDEADAVICSMTAHFHLRGQTRSFRADDGEIVLLEPPVPFPKRVNNSYVLTP